jgi:hydrogenase/urease accessory protein HupE
LSCLAGRTLRWLSALLLALWLLPAGAHQLRLGYLELTETAPGRYALLWKLPALGDDLRLALRVQLPPQCQAAGEVRRTLVGNAVSERWQLDCAGGLRGSVLGVEGLGGPAADVLVRLQHLDGSQQSARLSATSPSLQVAHSPGMAEVAASYFSLGVEHILGGLDHLLFVLALLLIVRGNGRLVATITAFTVAHSITLSLATFGLIALPGPPVEAAIALSIVFVAAEILRVQRGGSSLTARAPWLVAFAFGLLHGFGFAGALQETGLPQSAIPLALLCFNLGVEAGQLLFVVLVLILRQPLRRLLPQTSGWTRALLPYALGSIAMAWLIERVVLFQA